jgi:hypothetical protein
MTVGVALFLWSTGLPTLFHFAEAASITNASDTLSNSAPSQTSVHTIAFTQPNGMSQGQIFVIEFDSNFDLSGLVDETDVTMTVGGSGATIGATPGVGQWGVVIGGDNSIAFTTPTDGGVASSTEIIVTVGDEAGGQLVTNPSATTSYPINIGTDSATTTSQDSGQVRVAIIDEVLVTASVDTTLQFEVSGVGSAQAVNGTTTTGASTNLTLPFGTLSANTIETLAHDLNVTTNAANGYSVTVALSGDLQSSTGAIIDSFIDGADTSVPAAWQSPGTLIANDKTWGHWGITSDDFLNTGRASEFSSNAWAGIATTSPVAIMGHNAVADGSTAGIGSARIGYQIETSALQEAGTDYNTTLRYIATPTF